MVVKTISPGCVVWASILFYSNWTFIALNLPIQEDSKAQQNQKINRQISVSRGRRGVKHHREDQGIVKAMVGMLWCTGRF